LNFKRPESVLVVVHTADGEVLLLHRADRTDFWQSVTGSLEPGETPIEAARRELEEETGLDGSGIVDCRRRRRFPIAPEWRDRYAPEVTHNLEHEFRLGVGVRCRPRLNPAEHDGHAWLDVPDAAERATSWTNRAAIRSLDSDPARTTVVLVHGLWIGRHSMRLLARRLRAAGFGVALFGWHTTRETPDRAARRLAQQVETLEGEVIHFVGHSLGGFVLAHLLGGGYRPARAGRAVLLASPLKGATAAEHLEHRGLGRALGAAEEPLTEGAGQWPRDIPVARIAGVRACGPGRLLGSLPRPNDGTVALEDIRGPGGPVRLVRTTHLGLLLSGRAARMTAVYLRDGRLPSHREVTG
jgi:dATP pyrophosphohydrolase